MKTIDQITRIERASPTHMVCHFADGDAFAVRGDEALLDTAVKQGEEVCFAGHVIEPMGLPVMNYDRMSYEVAPGYKQVRPRAGGGVPVQRKQEYHGMAGSAPRTNTKRDGVEPMGLPQLTFDAPQTRNQSVENARGKRTGGASQSPPDKGGAAQEPRTVTADDGKVVVPLLVPRLF